MPLQVPSRTSLADSWRSIATLLRRRRRAAEPTSSVCDNITYLTASVLSSVQLQVPSPVPSSVQLQVPLPPTSEQPEDSMAYKTHIHILDDDSLFEIFSFFRLEDEESWILRFSWRNLTQVCRRWRYVIFDLSSHLDMCLPLSALTNDSPSINIPSYLPPLLLAINHYRTRAMTQKDEDNVRLGLQEHGRVRVVVLQASSSSLRMCLAQMN